MSVSQILDKKGHDVITVRSGASLKQVSDVLTQHNIGAAVVLTDTGEICGIVSERDVVRYISAGGITSMTDPISCSMTSEVIFSDGRESMDDAMAVMSENRFRHLPVVENGELSGLISMGDLVQHKIAATERDAEDLRRYISG